MWTSLALILASAFAGETRTATAATALATSTASTASYPAQPSSLARLTVQYPQGFGKKRIYLDPGHGVRGNEGATTAFCEREDDVVLRIARAVATELEASGHFTVRLARKGRDGPIYEERLRDAERFNADALVSLHLDARGEGELMTPPGEPALSCPRNDSMAGFGVLVSDRGALALNARRKRLAESIGRRLAEIGLPPYDGDDYGTRYAHDAIPGVFFDRRGLFMLRRPKIPSVIVETHHGWHLAESQRWKEAETIEAFARALEAGLVDTFASGR